MSDAILNHCDDRGVVTLTLNRPDLHNAFDEHLIHDLTQALRAVQDNPRARALVLTGSGMSFSAGADLNWMRRMAGYSEAQNRADADTLATLMSTLDCLPIPTIARVQGSAFGGGVGLVACCDIAVATTSTLFCLSEVKLGLIPAVISPYLIRAIGARHARRYFLTAERFNAAKAQRLGLLHKVVDHADLDATVESILQEFLFNSPAAIAAAKQLVAHVESRPVDQALIDYTAAQIATIRVSAEGREGLTAFLEKRSPAWVSQ